MTLKDTKVPSYGQMTLTCFGNVPLKFSDILEEHKASGAETEGSEGGKKASIHLQED